MLRWSDAADACDTTWSTAAEARAIARHLRNLGWVVQERTDRPGVAATVWHPDTWQSPGEIRHREVQRVRV